jgi:hypothetical protein
MTALLEIGNLGKRFGASNTLLDYKFSFTNDATLSQIKSMNSTGESAACRIRVCHTQPLPADLGGRRRAYETSVLRRLSFPA